MHSIDACRYREVDDAHLFVKRLAVWLVKLDRVDADPQRVLAAEPRANRTDDVDQQPRPILDLATPTVGTCVHRRRQELVDQIAMAGVQLDAVETCALTTLGRVDKTFDHPCKVAFGGDLILQA